MTENEIGTGVIGAAIKVHSTLGPGLLEGTYELCLAYELAKQGFEVRRQVSIPIRYDDLSIENAYRIDLLVDDCVVIELKSLETVLPVHKAQLLSYLRLGNFKLGYLLNFNVTQMRDGVVRVVNGLESSATSAQTPRPPR